MKRYKWFSLMIVFTLWGCSKTQSEEISSSEMQSEFAVATLAGGCYWCMEAAFEKLDGLENVTSGYAEGEGAIGKVEAIQIEELYVPKSSKYTNVALKDSGIRQDFNLIIISIDHHGHINT